MIEISGAWWKKNKAKTLSDEPLTAAFAVYDKAEAARWKDAIQPNYEQVRQALSHGLLPAIAATEKKCNKVLHKDTLKNLADLEKAVTREIKIIADHYDSMRAVKAGIVKLANTADAEYAKFQKSMSHADFKAFAKALHALETAVENMADNYDFYSPYQGQLHQKVHGLGETVAKVDEKFDTLFGANVDPVNAKKAPLIKAELDKGPANIRQWLQKMA